MSSEIVEEKEPAAAADLAAHAAGADSWRQELAQQLVERARAEGVQLSGPGGLLTGITRMVLERRWTPS